MNQEEWWDLYSIDGEYLHQSIKRGDEIPKNTYHKIVHIWIYNELGEFLIQKRAKHLTKNPEKWAATTGSMQKGHFDEKNEAYRELDEELGLYNTDIDLELIDVILFENTLAYVFIGFMPKKISNKIVLNDEVIETCWSKWSKIEQRVQENQFAKYSPQIFDLIKSYKLFN